MTKRANSSTCECFICIYLKTRIYQNEFLLLGSQTMLSLSYEPEHELSNNVVCATSKASDQPAHMLVPCISYDC